MVASAVQVAGRALLSTMRAVAVAFGVTLTCTRDSTDKEVLTNFRKLVRWGASGLAIFMGGRLGGHFQGSRQ